MAWLAAGCSGPTDSVQVVGSVERTLIELSAPVSEVIAGLTAERGTHVTAGEVVVRLDPTLAQAEVARADAIVAGMRTRVSVTRRDLERAADLTRRRVAAQDQLDHAQLAADEASAQLHEAQARLTVAQKLLADHTIIAPVAGVVDQIPFELGERVPAGAVVAVLLQDGAPWVRIWIPERAVALLGPGSPAAVQIDGVGRLDGHLLDVSREPAFTPHYALTERERVYLVYEARVAISNPPAGLRPGMPASVSIALRTAAAGSQ